MLLSLLRLNKGIYAKPPDPGPDKEQIVNKDAAFYSKFYFTNTQPLKSCGEEHGNCFSC